MDREADVTSDPHTHHLTRLAALSLRLPGTWAWGAVLRLKLATRPCRDAGCAA
jgi:hypothetical protein